MAQIKLSHRSDGSLQLRANVQDEVTRQPVIETITINNQSIQRVLTRALSTGEEVGLDFNDGQVIELCFHKTQPPPGHDDLHDEVSKEGTIGINVSGVGPAVEMIDSGELVKTILSRKTDGGLAHLTIATGEKVTLRRKAK